ncbi:MAG: PilZ domain-containing protein [Candidatus Omnitrophica bacterium]|jgi:c-di-GMP-binding flagellar brake protein YcgR|nr:PilZ domain-containing protein [Candidatus Omnitrophota bacterium]MDD5253072.1 PilZ domain-containing protein [Candidatus Omnitrophota bacterium]
MQERRRYARVPESLQIAYEILPTDTTKQYLTKDISQGGIRFFTHEFIPKDTRLRIRISFPRTLFSFETLVRCMWIKQMPYGDEFEVGVEFVDLPPEIIDYLISYIKVSLKINTQQPGV